MDIPNTPSDTHRAICQHVPCRVKSQMNRDIGNHIGNTMIARARGNENPNKEPRSSARSIRSSRKCRRSTIQPEKNLRYRRYPGDGRKESTCSPRLHWKRGWCQGLATTRSRSARYRDNTTRKLSTLDRSSRTFLLLSHRAKLSRMPVRS